MITIAVHGAEFFAYHGFYPEEALLGARFIVDVEVVFEPMADLKQDNIGDTVNYEEIYHVISAHMKHTRKLIEAVAQSIGEELKMKYPFVDSVKVTLKKMHPPLAGKVDHSGVTVSLNR
jgi:dihydroneopterin aldolase